jgi:hypothetical protein
MVRDSGTGLVWYHGTLWRSPIAPRIVQLISLVFGLLYALLAARFFVEYVGAPHGVPIVATVRQWSDVFYAPFNGLLPVDHDRGGHPIVWSLVAAAAAYAILHAAIVAIVRAIARVGER